MSARSQPELVPPKCPHCGEAMPSIGLFNWLAGPWMIMAAYCHACKKALHFTTVPARIIETGEPGEEQPPARTH